MGWRTDRERGAPSHLPRNPIIKPAIHHWDHVGLAMRDPRRAIELFRDVFGGQFIVGGDNLQIGIRSLVFKLPAKVKVEFLSPLYPDSYLAKYLEEHGEGFHHATLFVDDIVSTIQDLEAHGFETVDTKLDDSHWLETFLRPKSTFGCLIQVVQSDLDWYEPHPVCTPEAVLAGEWRWWGTQVWHVSALPSDYSEERVRRFQPKT